MLIGSIIEAWKGVKDEFIAHLFVREQLTIWHSAHSEDWAELKRNSVSTGTRVELRRYYWRNSGMVAMLLQSEKVGINLH